MEILKEKYSITELSEKLQVTDHALRFYEKEFNLSIPKDSRGRRYYSTENANIMYQIKTMRKEGLEIKAIRKIFQSNNIINDPPPIVADENSVSLVSTNMHDNGINDIKAFFNEFKEQLTSGISTEITTAKEHLSKEITRSKLELGACVENGMRKIEAKMERHFQEAFK